MKNLKQNYKELAAKYQLPSFEELDKEFELLYIREVFEIPHPLSFVRRRINDKFNWVCNMLQNIIQPNPGSIIGMKEASFFSKEQKEACLEILKDLMLLERSSLQLDIATSTEDDAAFIKKTFEEWKKVKPKVHEITKLFAEGWKKEEKSEEKKSHYFG